MKIILTFLLFTLLMNNLISATENADIIVAKDGTGNFTTIQKAIESIKPNNTEFKIILVKNGLYNEKLFINNSNIAIVGENKDSTIIQFAELRKNWMQNHNSQFWFSYYQYR